MRTSASRTEPPSMLRPTVHELMVPYSNKMYACALSDPRAEAGSERCACVYERIANRTTERASVDGSQVDGSVQ